MGRKRGLLSILESPPRKRRNQRGFFGTLLEGQRRTERTNTPGSKRKYKSKLWK